MHAPVSAPAYIGKKRKVVPVVQEVCMKEKDIECRLIRAVRRLGGLALKLVSPGFNGVPDRRGCKHWVGEGRDCL